MRSVQSTRTVLIATSDAKLLTWSAALSEPEWEQINALLSGLAQLGHVALFSIEAADGVMPYAELITTVRRKFGDFIVDALLTTAHAAAGSRPAYLIPVWPFDHEIEGRPASTARFFYLDLEVQARSTDDEELGITLAGREGLWLIGARPIHSPHFFGKVRATGH